MKMTYFKSQISYSHYQLDWRVLYKEHFNLKDHLSFQDNTVDAINPQF